MTFRLTKVTTLFACLLVTARCGEGVAGEIRLADFTGDAVVVDGIQLTTRTFGDGGRILGGKELYTSSPTSSPFSLAPTDGDPQGFVGASLGTLLSAFIPGPMTISFANAPVRPNRVGLLVENYGVAPYYDHLMVELFMEDESSTYYEYSSGRRLLAYQESSPIVSMMVHWSPGNYFAGDGPRVSFDDLRYEVVAVPEPATGVLATFAVVGIACSLLGKTLRRKKVTEASSRSFVMKADN